MRQLFAVIAVFAFLGCSTPTEERKIAAAQAAVNTLCTAIVTQDTELLASVWAPDRLEKDLNRRQVEFEHFITQQRDGLIRTFGEKAPQVAEVIKGANGVLTVAVAHDGYVEPKTLEMFEAEDGKIYYAGLGHSRLAPAPGTQLNDDGTAAAQQGVNGDIELWHFKIWNDSAFFQSIHNTYDIAANPCPRCFTNTQVCLGEQSFSGINPHSTVYPGPNFNCTRKGSSCGVRMLFSGSGNFCACNNGSSCAAATSCCYWAQFGDDFWWSSGASLGALPFCHVDSCSY